MKKIINSRVGYLFLTLMVSYGNICYAGIEDFQLSVRNLTQPAPNRIEFDLYLLDTDPDQPFELSGCQFGFLLNSLIYNGGVLSVAIDNTGSGLLSDQQFVSAPDIVSSLTGYPGLTLIRLAGNSGPPVPPGAGSGTVISISGYGTLLTHFIVTSTVDFTPNSMPDLGFTPGTAVSPLYPTLVSQFVDGTETPLTVTPGVNAIVDGNPLLNATLPSAFNVTGSGSYCVGDDGLTVGLDDSEADVTYTLYREGVEIASLAGNGNAISFGLRLEGIYTAEGTNAAGTVPMNGQAEIIAEVNTAGPGSSSPTLCINSPLTAITHTTTGATGIGTPLNLPSGVTAIWAANTITISGTPGASGTFNYSVPLTGGCGTVSATGTITVNPLPTITGVISGSRCGPGTVVLGATASAGVINWYSNISGGTSLFTGSSFTTPVISLNTGYYVDATNNGCTSTARTLVMAIVNTIPTITNTTPASRCGTGTVTLGATASAGTVNWYSASTGGTSLGTGINFNTPAIISTTTYYVDATSNGCTTAVRTAIIATVLQVPSSAGPISGPATFTPGTAGIPYSVAPIAGATGYQWSYTGTGVTINGSGNSVTLDFSGSATPGQLSVLGTNTCGEGISSTLDLSPSVKTLTLNSILLEGLYNGGGTMRQAIGDSGPQWGPGIADHIIVELRSAAAYATLVTSFPDIELSTSGTATVNIPAGFSGTYFITIKHRNSVETTTAAPVSFAGTVINLTFASTANVFGSNLGESYDSYYLIFGGDVNQDGFVDSGDYPDVVNDNFNYVSGYHATDINGDGFIDSGDYPIMVNNNFRYVGTIHP